jgi:phage terminase Nu1 subunit (DNA packaging protein)
MNLQAYADHRKARGLRGTSHVAVLKAIESGRLTEPAVRKDGKQWRIDATLADAQWSGNTSNMPDNGTELPEPPNTRQPHPEGGGPSLAQAKRAKAVYEAELTRLELQKTKKELISADEVRQEASRLGRQVRDLLLMIPARNAAKLCTMQNQEDIRLLLQVEIESALRGLANA